MIAQCFNTFVTMLAEDSTLFGNIGNPQTAPKLTLMEHEEQRQEWIWKPQVCKKALFLWAIFLNPKHLFVFLSYEKGLT